MPKPETNSLLHKLGAKTKPQEEQDKDPKKNLLAGLKKRVAKSEAAAAAKGNSPANKSKLNVGLGDKDHGSAVPSSAPANAKTGSIVRGLEGANSAPGSGPQSSQMGSKSRPVAVQSGVGPPIPRRTQVGMPAVSLEADTDRRSHSGPAIPRRSAPSMPAMKSVDGMLSKGKLLQNLPKAGEPSQVQATCRFPLVLLASGEDSARKQLSAMLMDEKIAGQVVGCKDGDQLVVAHARLLKKGVKPNLIAADTALPLLSGQKAAVVIRGLEEGFGIQGTTPIVLMGAEAPKGMVRLTNYLKNANYLHIPQGHADPHTAVTILQTVKVWPEGLL